MATPARLDGIIWSPRMGVNTGLPHLLAERMGHLPQPARGPGAGSLFPDSTHVWQCSGRDRCRSVVSQIVDLIGLAFAVLVFVVQRSDEAKIEVRTCQEEQSKTNEGEHPV